MNAPGFITAAALLAIGLASPVLASSDGIAREGLGTERRAALDKMELTLFPASAWERLSSWTNGSALTAAAIDGKPVLIVTFSSWYRLSHAALAVAQQMANKFGPSGLVVVGVHDQAGWEGAGKLMADRELSFLYAHDTSNKFRAALKVDQDPDFYLIDRAGNLRFADIETGAVEAAVSKVVSETRQDAAALPQRLADKAAAAQADSLRSRSVSAALRPGELLDVPFDMPDVSLFNAAKWPEKNGGDLGAANNVQGMPLPASLGTETWITEQPKLGGRVVVLDFWATWCGPCKRAMPGLDELQRTFRQDLVIIGMSGQPAGSFKEDVAAVRAFLVGHKSAYSHANDLTQVIYKSLQVQGIPHVVVISTDGVVRWQGNPLDPNFRKAVVQTISVDPGIAARRAAEADYLRKHAG